MSEPSAEQHDPSAARSAEVLVRIRSGAPPRAIIHDLLAQGSTPEQVSASLREVYRVLEGEREAATREREAQLAGQIARDVSMGLPNRRIAEQLVAQGVSVAAATELVRDARAARARRQSAPHASARPTPAVLAGGATGVRWLALVGIIGALILALQYGSGVGLLWQLRSGGQPASKPHAVMGASAIDSTIEPVQNAVVVAQHLNVRSGPGREYPLLAQLSSHDPLYIIGKTADARRFKVKLLDNRVGWIRGDPAMVQLYVSPDSIPLTTAR